MCASISVAAGCVIKAVRETAALMFGVSVSTMIGCDLAQFLPTACPSKNATDMLIVGDTSATAKKGGLGAKGKKTVGKLMPLVSTSTGHETGTSGSGSTYAICWGKMCNANQP